jgi:cytochrome c peroxidase
MMRPILILAAMVTANMAAAGPATHVPSPAEVAAVIGHLGPAPAPPDGPLTAARVELGQRLFEDPSLSGDGSTACMTCHLPHHGYAASTRLGPAYPSQAERRNAPTLINVAYNEPLNWDGRAPLLNQQAADPIGNVLHMNGDLDHVVEQLAKVPSYLEDFTMAYGDEAITPERIADAIASFERTLVFDGSPLDLYMGGDGSALSDRQKRGLALFMGKARCVACHHGPNLTDHRFHNLGVPDDHVTGDAAVMAAIRSDARATGYPDWATLEEDPGRAQITHHPADLGAFRTMGLRNIKESPPYMHNGALRTLEDVVRFYNRGGGDHPNKSEQVVPLGLSDDEVGDLVAFLEQALQGAQRQLD